MSVEVSRVDVHCGLGSVCAKRRGRERSEEAVGKLNFAQKSKVPRMSLCGCRVECGKRACLARLEAPC